MFQVGMSYVKELVWCVSCIGYCQWALGHYIWMVAMCDMHSVTRGLCLLRQQQGALASLAFAHPRERFRLHKFVLKGSLPPGIVGR